MDSSASLPHTLILWQKSSGAKLPLLKGEVPVLWERAVGKKADDVTAQCQFGHPLSSLHSSNSVPWATNP